MRVEEGHLVQQPVEAAFGARAVVAHDVDHERVVELADLVDRVDDAADFVVGVGGEGREDLHHAGVDAFFLLRAASPRPAASRAAA